MESARIIAAVKSDDALDVAIKSDVEIIFLLSPNIGKIRRQAETVHKAGKKLFIHLDFAEGIGRDEYGIQFAKHQGVDGIISTRTNIIKLARKLGLFSVQRCFIVDTQSIDTTVESAEVSKADMIEIMPGTMSKVIKRLKARLKMPVVAGGLIETTEEIKEAIDCGAAAVSTGKSELWG